MSNIDFSCFKDYKKDYNSLQQKNIEAIMRVCLLYEKYLGFSNPVKFHKCSNSKAYCNRVPYYHLDFNTEKYLDTDIDYTTGHKFLEMATELAHEFGHMYFKDIEFFKPYGYSKIVIPYEDGAFRKPVEKDSLKTAISTLKETRADVFAAYLVRHHFGIPNFDWVISDGDYRKDGYFTSSMRKYIVEKFPEYNRDVVEYVLGIFKRDDFVSEYGILRNTKVFRRVDSGKLHPYFKGNIPRQTWLIRLMCK